MSSTSGDSLQGDRFNPVYWDAEANRPIVDGQYNDPRTGELRTSTGAAYMGPPSVDIIIMNLHQDSNEGIYRATRPFPMEKLLFHMMRIVHERGLQIDSINSTAYAIRIILAHELKKEEFVETAHAMLNAIWDER
ncbi:hypothetical protein CDV36_003121 [Fusarium kuroshium]|uniref:Uncharacterized protein n=1 Tax=Fusarium kuroshium TaxID=2010991 RepID=A0A3M2SI43_9HYPO|nr:hypothetical protein CDV36_003121 [Fusarium kuroshium]